MHMRFPLRPESAICRPNNDRTLARLQTSLKETSIWTRGPGMPYSEAYKSAMLLAWDPSICGKTELCLTCSTTSSVSNLVAFWLHLQTRGLQFSLVCN